MTTLERLTEVLVGEGWTLQDSSPGGHRFTYGGGDRAGRPGNLGGRQEDEPDRDRRRRVFVLRATTEDLDCYLDGLGDSGQQVFGTSVAAGDANFQLLLVHLGEHIDTHPPGSTVTFTGDTITGDTITGDTSTVTPGDSASH